MHLSTTFVADNAQGLVYSREDQPTRRRLEAVLGALEGGHAVVYSSGLAAVQALLMHLKPRRVVLASGGYLGTHQVLEQWSSLGVVLVPLDSNLQRDDLVWLETPSNPTCEVADIASFVERARGAGARVAVDSTFATPILQQPLALDADFAMHSSSKFLSGHHDALGGVLVATQADRAARLRHERAVLGSTPGALETWLTLRSLRTLDLRVKRQSASATELAAWLQGRVPKVWHPSLPGHPGYEVGRRQMKGPGGMLSIELESDARAREFPSRLKLFRDATSLGGVESQVDWRRRHDPQAPAGLLRISVGLEDPRDLIADLARAGC